MIQNLQMRYSIISKERTQLMGFGIFGIMLQHLMIWSGFSSTPLAQFINHYIVNMVYTGGFIMLSGFGLYYSIEKNGFENYFRRRVFRLLIPFWLISLPFYTILFFKGEMSFLDVFYELTTIGTWINGNTYGMWYIAAAVLSYFIFPISYKIVKTKWPIIASISFIIVSTIVIFLIKRYASPLLTDGSNLVLSVICLLPLGVMIGKLSYEDSNVNKYLLAITIVALPILDYKAPNFVWDFFYKFICVVLLSYILGITSRTLPQIRRLLTWGGQYSLELYIIHLLMYNTLCSLGIQPCIAGWCGVLAAIASVKYVKIGCNYILERL